MGRTSHFIDLPEDLVDGALLCVSLFGLFVPPGDLDMSDLDCFLGILVLSGGQVGD